MGIRLDEKVAHTKPFEKDFLWISKRDFEKIKKYFACDWNLFNKEKSYRSYSWLIHIHALEQGEHVFLHKDVGNLGKFLPLGMIHFLVDVVPFFLGCLFTRTAPKTLLCISKKEN